jgi:PAS domain S-box-containing protein
MNEPSEKKTDWEAQRKRIIGLGESSIRKSYYPELQQRIQELEKKNRELRTAYSEQTAIGEELHQQIDETGRKEQQLRESEERFSRFMENLPAAVYIKDPDGLVVFSNRYMNELLGWVNPTGKSTFDLLPRETAQQMVEDDRNAIRQGVHSTVESLTDIKGNLRIFSTTKFALPDPTLRHPLLGGISLDITEMKRQEKILQSQLNLGLALQENHGLSETLEICLSAAIEISDMDAGGIYLVDKISGAVDLMVSCNLGEDFVKSVSHYPPDSVNAQMVMAGKPVYLPYCKTGVVHIPVQEQEGLLATAIIPIATGGRIIACINITSHTHVDIARSAQIALETIATDIGTAIERIRSQDALKKSEERYRSLVDITDTGYLVLDNRGLVIEANEVYVRLTGRKSLSDIIGRPVTEWTAPYDLERNVREVEKCLSTGQVRGLEIDYVKPDGTFLPIEVNATVFPTGAGDVILTICRDISDRKRINVALQQARNKLNLLNAVTFQDIQTAAFSLSAYQELLKTTLPDAKTKSYLDKQELFLKKMVDTLDFAKHYQEMGIHPPRWQNVRQVYLYAISHLEFLHMKQDIRFDTLEVFADSLFETALSNIMANVLRHGVRATIITMRYEEKPDFLTLFIEDNGVGIPAEEKNMIFDRGYGKGAGLGLFLVREVLSITGMTIKETGIPGQGLRLEITVPKVMYRFGDLKNPAG